MRLRLARLRRLRDRAGARRREFFQTAACAKPVSSARATIEGMAYTDFFTSRAFAVCDHGFAHVYCRDESSKLAAAEALRTLPGVAEVWDKNDQEKHGIAHRRSGDLVITAAESAWFAYPWFTERDEAPDYASHVDIHNKPGYDPCELYFGWPPGSVSFDTRKIRGTHGSNRTGLEVAWATSLKIPQLPGDAARPRARGADRGWRRRR